MFVVLISIGMWIMLAVSIVGVFYAIFFAIFFFLAHVAFVAHLRGSSVRIGPDQLPDLHARIEDIAGRLGMTRLPEAYVMQAGGTLNALATKFFRSHFIVLYSELLNACAEDDPAADFVIAHELGHVKAGHLRFQWFLIGRFFPFIGSAYSRAREYTADRYGASICSDPSAAVRGLAILAAGPTQAKSLNLPAMMRQRHDLNTVLMMLGRWMASHPPIVDRIAEVDRTLAGDRIVPAPAVLGAAGLIALGFVAPLVGGGFLMQKMMKTIKEAGAQAQAQSHSTPTRVRPRVVVADVPGAVSRAQKEMRDLAAVADTYHLKTGRYPEDVESLYALWRLDHPRDGELRDPFDGSRYGYEYEDGEYDIWSAASERNDVHERMHVTSNESAPPGR